MFNLPTETTPITDTATERDIRNAIIQYEVGQVFLEVYPPVPEDEQDRPF